MMYFRTMLIYGVTEAVYFTTLSVLTLYHCWRTLSHWICSSKSDNHAIHPLSIIIAAHNEEKNLAELLPLLTQQKYKDFEIIVVLDRCTDNSEKVVKIFSNEYSFINYYIISEGKEGYDPKKFAINSGIKNAENEWLVFTDADCRPASPFWLSKINKYLDEDTDFVLGFSPYFRENTLLNYYIRYETFITGTEYLASACINYPYMGVGRNLIYRKSVFNTKGFGNFQHLTGGDDDLFVHHYAEGKRTKSMTGDATLTYSRGKTSYSQYFRQKRRHYHVGKYYKVHSKLIHGIKYSLHLLLWISFIILALQKQTNFLIVLSFFGYFIVKGLLDWGASKKLGDGYPFWSGPFLDLFYSVFVPVAAGIASASKKVTWK